ncbi:predicted protein [Histoplasma capsulatum G186AR]|uniref:Uncharacterized protein n=1 Tax=Ajellomyces capsulatus (strain G186AR / H82 / ATCC MYA-2454 / RMSCC 2432) TaxID=447093 RepID=C0NF72_AJECG|nr:uncharacterized protein HCBG_01538 [Histoplasma capsulatum G186AR]EEH09893.1 predicted protein [Histoplasma capsulatum G186AR]
MYPYRTSRLGGKITRGRGKADVSRIPGPNYTLPTNQDRGAGNQNLPDAGKHNEDMAAQHCILYGRRNLGPAPDATEDIQTLACTEEPALEVVAQFFGLGFHLGIFGTRTVKYPSSAGIFRASELCLELS